MLYYNFSAPYPMVSAVISQNPALDMHNGFLSTAKRCEGKSLKYYTSKVYLRVYQPSV